MSPRRRGIGRRVFGLGAADNTVLPCRVRADQEAAGDADPHFGPPWSIEPGGRIDDRKRHLDGLLDTDILLKRLQIAEIDGHAFACSRFRLTVF